jgi:hypothetical protein
LIELRQNFAGRRRLFRNRYVQLAESRDGIRVFTLGVGTASGAILRMTDPYGNAVFVKDSEGNAVKSRLNENLLAPTPLHFLS